jgi:predicted esterase
MCIPCSFRFTLAIVLGALFPLAAHCEKALGRYVSPSGASYNYVAWIPDSYTPSSASRYPMLLSLHGAGQVGVSWDEFASYGMPPFAERTQNMNCITITPHCPRYGWDSETLKLLIEDLTLRYHLDPDRIYVTGVSMGGVGTWDLACHAPELIAAIAPVCGYGNIYYARQMKDVPAWVFHGMLDTVIPPSLGLSMVDALRDAGGTVRTSLYSDAGHDIWDRSYSDMDLYVWLLQQNKVSIPQLSHSPETQSAEEGKYVVLRAQANGAKLSYRWKHNGTVINGANEPLLKIASVKASDAGVYQAEIYNTAGTVNSSSSILYVEKASAVTHLTALSVRANAGRDDNTLIIGINVSDESHWVYGNPSDAARLPVLMRAIGPSLWKTSIANFMRNPNLCLFKEQSRLCDNDNWEGDALVTDLSAVKGLQAIVPESRDAAFVKGLLPGTYTMHVSPAATSLEGIAVAECYEVNAGLAENTPRLRALSTRALVTPGDGALIVGFIISGAKPMKVLVRALGPTLAKAGIKDTLQDPVISIYSNDTPLYSNDNWGGDPVIAAGFSKVGLSALPVDSKEAALLVSLPEGSYTAVVTGKDGQRGVSIVEFYGIDE